MVPRRALAHLAQAGSTKSLTLPRRDGWSITHFQAVIANLNETPVSIDIAGDVDFTDIVEILSGCIDKGEQINLTITDESSIVNEKDKLIVKTLKGLFDTYNNALHSVEETAND